ncbi:hypothetical protein M408DRAFT_327018 [Serendipita vermifera MAFF 305830]|uniref:F-box domain-containing protein n=1 Tax=Serendipita vermifera MAFF 305830 TaxID=933852 RepID=A0A0C3B6K2_SERVB|nr:hypothetical protein M408DRAFT_327018 [Serendipita vermifera MAFF 305830]
MVQSTSSRTAGRWHGDNVLLKQSDGSEFPALLPSPTPLCFSNSTSPQCSPLPVQSFKVPSLKLETLTIELLFEIIEHMDLEDALRFRLVSKHCAEVVLMAPSILKRLLRHVKLPLPYSPKPIQSLGGKEVISLCRRAFALDANWQRKLDRLRAYSFFPLHRSYLVSLAPGGRYLVAAYHSTSGEEHFIGLYDLENPQGMVCLASCPTETPLDRLTTTWMEIKGKMGIAVTWVREIPINKTHVGSPDVEVSVLFISLDMIEALADPEHTTEDAPFEYLCCRRWKSCTIRVCTANGLLAVARSPDTLSFYDLESEEKSTIKLPHLPLSQMADPVIFAIKIMCDGTALIVRSEDGHSSQLNLHAIEAYAIPEMGQTAVDPPPVQCNYLHSNQTNYDISSMYQRQSTSDDPSTEEVIEALAYLPPVTISVESSPPAKGITQYRLFPTYVSEPEPRFGYVWPVTVWQGHYSEHDQDRTQTLNVAGADRSLSFPFTSPGRAQTPALSEFMVLDSFGDDTIPSVGLPKSIERDVVQCVSWDESSGKLCLSTVGDLKIWVLDFAV